jgi:hypothetical protein
MLLKEASKNQRTAFWVFVAGLLVVPLAVSVIVTRAQCSDSWFSKLLGVSSSCGNSSRQAEGSGQIAFTDASGQKIKLNLSELADFVAAQKDKGFSDFAFAMDGDNLVVSAGGEKKSLNLSEFATTILQNAANDPNGDQQVLSINGKKLTIYGGNTIDLAQFLGLADYNSGDGVVVTGGSRIISSVLGTSISTDEIEDGVIINSKLGDASISTDKLQDSSVEGSKIAENSISTDKIVDGTILFADLNDNGCESGQVIKYSGTDWTCGTGVSAGDVKSGMQSVDHGGWVRLDGRPLADLTEDQQIAASALGLSDNLPNANNAFLVQNNTAIGSLSNSNTKTISRAQLPNVTLGGSTDSSGAHSHSYTTNSTDGAAHPVAGGSKAFSTSDYSATTNTSGAHTHNITTSSINGNVAQQGLDITPLSLSVNMFIYLGL